MSKTIKTYPAVGWVRANLTSSEKDLRSMVDLQKENEMLKSELVRVVSNLNQTLELNLADFEDDFVFSCESIFSRSTYEGGGTKKWSVTMKWKDIFSSISPYLTQYYSESNVSSTLARSAQKIVGKGGTSPSVMSQDLKTIGVQLRAYGLVKVEHLKTTNGGMGIFWSLTESGHTEMLKIRTVKNKNNIASE